MNKKQLIVAWIVGILSSTLLFRGLGVYRRWKLIGGGYGGRRFWTPTIWSYLAIILIIGGLLFYTLRDKKK